MTPSSLRQAVQPAIAAYRLLAGDQERARRSTAQCEEPLSLSGDVLHAIGHAAIAGTQETGAGETSSPEILDAYANAALAWAKVVGSTMALGATMVDTGDWDEVRRLADVLAAAGESNAAIDLRTQLGKALWRSEEHTS